MSAPPGSSPWRAVDIHPQASPRGRRYFTGQGMTRRKGVPVSAYGFNSNQTPWQLVFRHAFDVAIAHGAEDQAIAEALAISHHDRGVVAAARANCSAILAVAPQDHLTRKAFHLLDRTLHEGDDHESWGRVA